MEFRKIKEQMIKCDEDDGETGHIEADRLLIETIKHCEEILRQYIVTKDILHIIEAYENLTRWFA